MTPAAIIALLTGIVGLISTILAYRWNPKRLLQAKLDAVAHQIKHWEGKKDEALAKNDIDGLNVSIAKLVELHNDQASLLAQR